MSHCQVEVVWEFTYLHRGRSDATLYLRDGGTTDEHECYMVNDHNTHSGWHGCWGKVAGNLYYLSLNCRGKFFPPRFVILERKSNDDDGFASFVGLNYDVELMYRTLHVHIEVLD